MLRVSSLGDSKGSQVEDSMLVGDRPQTSVASSSAGIGKSQFCTTLAARTVSPAGCVLCWKGTHQQLISGLP